MHPTVTGSESAPLVDAHGAPLRARASTTAHRAADRFSQEMARFNPMLRSADDAWLAERDTVAARLHHLVDNNGWAAGAVTRYVDQIVGSQYRLSARPDFEALGQDADWAFEWARTIESRWKAYANDPRRFCDAAERRTVPQLLGLQLRHSYTDGESLSLSLWLPRDGFNWATSFQVIDPDRLSNPQGGMDTDRLRGGVEINDLGAPQAYWIKDTHPGEFFTGANSNRWTRVERKVPGQHRARVIHFFEDGRAGQSRGKSPLTPVIERVKMLDHYERTEMQAALTNAIFAAFIESPFDPEMTADAFAGTDSYQASRMAFHDQAALKLDGMSVPILFPGENFKFTTAARPNTGFADFESAALRYCSAASGFSYEELASDYSKSNYSSIRAAFLSTFKFLTARGGAFASGCATPHYALWLEEELDRDPALVPPGAPSFWDAPVAWTGCRWFGPGRGWVDPTKEAQASQMRMDTGVSTLEDEAGDQGKDWVEVLHGQAAERRLRDQLGLPHTTWAVIAESGKGAAGKGGEAEEDSDARDARESAEAAGVPAGRSMIPVTHPARR